MKDLSRAHFSKTKHLFCNVSLYCNKSCSYCYLPIESRSNKYSIPLDELVKYLHIFKKLNVEYVTLGGGEPSCLDNFNIVTQTISDLGFNLIVHTNGSISKNQLKYLAELNISYISFSLDSINPIINDVGRFIGATETTIENINEASSLKLPIRISTVVTKNNISEIEQLVKLSETLNINLINIHNIEILDHQLDDVKNKSLSPEEWIIQFKKWITIAKESKVFIRAPVSYLPLEYVIKIYDNNIACPAKHCDAFYLFPSGNVYRCPLIDNKDIYAWNILDHNLLVDSPKDNIIYEGNSNCNGMCPIVIKRYSTNYDELFPVCPFVKTTLNPLGGVINLKWDNIIHDFINQY